jgi:hypothetical protein
MEYEFDILKEKFQSLPGDLQQAISSIEVAAKVDAIAKKYKLLIDKEGELSDEVAYVMLGIHHPNDFVKNLAERLGVKKETAEQIAADVNNEIFLNVRESLKKIHEQKEDAVEELKGPTAATINVPTSQIVTENQENLNREEVLQGIENPSGITPPGAAPQKPVMTDAAPLSTEENPVRNDIIQAIEEPQIYPAKISEPASSIVRNKLSSITTMPKDEGKNDKNNAAGYKADPYREPIQ